MAEGSKNTVSVVPLNGSTWKIQAKMLMLKEGLWKLPLKVEMRDTPR